MRSYLNYEDCVKAYELGTKKLRREQIAVQVGSSAETIGRVLGAFHAVKVGTVVPGYISDKFTEYANRYFAEKDMVKMQEQKTTNAQLAQIQQNAMLQRIIENTLETNNILRKLVRAWVAEDQ